MGTNNRDRNSGLWPVGLAGSKAHIEALDMAMSMGFAAVKLFIFIGFVLLIYFFGCVFCLFLLCSYCLVVVASLPIWWLPIRVS